MSRPAKGSGGKVVALYLYSNVTDLYEELIKKMELPPNVKPPTLSQMMSDAFMEKHQGGLLANTETRKAPLPSDFLDKYRKRDSSLAYQEDKKKFQIKFITANISQLAQTFPGMTPELIYDELEKKLQE